MSEPSTEILSPDGQFRWDGQAWVTRQTPLDPPQPVIPADLMPRHSSPARPGRSDILRNPKVLGGGAVLLVGAIAAVVVMGGGHASSSGATAKVNKACTIYDPNQNGDLRDESQLPNAIALAHQAAKADPAYRNFADDFDQYNIDEKKTLADGVSSPDLFPDAQSVVTDMTALRADCTAAATK